MNKEELIKTLKDTHGSEDPLAYERAIGLALGYILTLDDIPRFTKNDAKEMAMITASNGNFPDHWDQHFKVLYKPSKVE